MRGAALGLKGLVENQIGYARDKLFKPRSTFQTLEKLIDAVEARGTGTGETIAIATCRRPVRRPACCST